jgi:hypothetical protein
MPVRGSRPADVRHSALERRHLEPRTQKKASQRNSKPINLADRQAWDNRPHQGFFVLNRGGQIDDTQIIRSSSIALLAAGLAFTARASAARAAAITQAHLLGDFAFENFTTAVPEASTWAMMLSAA